MQDNLFDPEKYNEPGEIVKMKYCGGWLIVDNGYLDWGVTIKTVKKAMYYKETRWSQ